MTIELHEISIRNIANGYVDNQDEGVLGYNKKLNIRQIMKEPVIFFV
jgi:hypothetical protein